MLLFSFQFFGGRANPHAEPPEPGYYPYPCPRYHRFKVTTRGNFTFVSPFWEGDYVVTRPVLARVGVLITPRVSGSRPIFTKLLAADSGTALAPSMLALTRVKSSPCVCVFQDTCSSMMDVAVMLFERTDNLSESEPMFLSNGSSALNQRFEVPLHRFDTLSKTIPTGLKKVQPDRFPRELVEWLHTFEDPKFPTLKYEYGNGIGSFNGCPLSTSAHRTFFLEAGDYFLQTSGIDPGFTCSTFNVKMGCSGGAATTSPADSDPRGFLVDVETGAITGTPVNTRDGYRMQLRAVDAADKRTTVADWTFDVRDPPDFALNRDAGWSDATDAVASKYHVGDTHLLPKPRLNKRDLLRDPAGGDFDKVVYLLSAEAVGSNPNCTVVDTNETQVISALTDVKTGGGAINIPCVGNYTATLTARDGAGKEVTIRNWTFEVLRKDTDVSKYGPGGHGCANGNEVDGELMDGQFTCNCAGTKFTGNNCEIESAASEQDDTTSYVIGAVFAVLVLGAGVVFLVVRYQRYQRSMMVTDFQAQLEQMKRTAWSTRSRSPGTACPVS